MAANNIMTLISFPITFKSVINYIVTCRLIAREQVGKIRFHGNMFSETSPSLCDKQTAPRIRDTGGHQGFPSTRICYIRGEQN
jgi:hypothetical protein